MNFDLRMNVVSKPTAVMHASGTLHHKNSCFCMFALTVIGMLTKVICAYCTDAAVGALELEIVTGR